MRTCLDCLSCFLSQALRAARKATDDEALIKQVLDEVGMMRRYLPSFFSLRQNTASLPMISEFRKAILS